MTIDEAYVAMFLFLEQFYDETQSDDVGLLLGTMNLVGPRRSMDPAVWSDWEDAVAKAPQKWEEFCKQGRQGDGSSA